MSKPTLETKATTSALANCTNAKNLDNTNEETFQWESLPEFYNEYMADLYAWLDHPLV